MNARQNIVASIGVIVTIVGVWLRLAAGDTARYPEKAAAFMEIGRVCLAFGLVVLLIVLVHYLWFGSSRHP